MKFNVGDMVKIVSLNGPLNVSHDFIFDDIIKNQYKVMSIHNDNGEVAYKLLVDTKYDDCVGWLFHDYNLELAHSGFNADSILEKVFRKSNGIDYFNELPF